MRWWRWMLLGLPMLVALGVALMPQARTGMWMDEVYSLLLSRGEGYRQLSVPLGKLLGGYPDPVSLEGASSLSSIWVKQAQDAHPPLYFVLLRMWREVFGTSPAAARSFSTVCYVLATLIVTLAGYRVSGRLWPAIAGGLVMALSTNGTWFAQEIRDYAQLVLAVSLVFFAHVSLLRAPSRGWVWVYAGAVLAAGLTHYLAIGVVLPSIVAILVSVGWEWRGRLGLALVTVCAIYGAAWGPFAVRQESASQGMTSWVSGHELPVLERVSLFFSAPGRAVGIPARGALTLGMALTLLFAWKAWISERRVLWWMAAGATFGPAALLLAGDLWAGAVTLWWTRYLLPALPGAAMTAVMLASERGRLRWTGALLPLLALLSLAAWPVLETDYPQVVKESRELGPAATTVFVVPDKTTEKDIETSVQTLAMLYAAHSGGISGPVVLLDRPMQDVSSLGDSVVVISAWQGYELREYFPGYRPTQKTRSFPTFGVWLLHLVRETEPTTTIPATKP